MWFGRRKVVVCGAEPLAKEVADSLGAAGMGVRLLGEDAILTLKPMRNGILVLAEPAEPSRLVAELMRRYARPPGRARRARTRLLVMHRADPPPELPVPAADSGLIVETLGVEGRAARALLTRWPLHLAMDPIFGQVPHLLIAGLAPPARAYLLQALRLIHYGEGRPRVTVLSASPEQDAAAFTAEYPQARAIADLEFASLDALDLKDRPKVTLAFVSLGAPAAHALSTAQTLARAIERTQQASPPILVEIGEAGPTGRLADWDGQLIPVSYLGEVCRPEVLLEGAGDAVARTIHEHYCDTIAAQGRDPGSEPAGKPWEQLASSYRQANRHQADHLRAKLAVTDCRALPEEMVESFSFSPLEIERLAVIEHERWAADRYLNGWSFAPERDNVRKHHPQLIPYAALSTAMKDLDRFAVRGVPTLLARSGLGVVRTLIVALPDPAPGTQLDHQARGAMPRVLERLRLRYPDRALVFAATLEHADVRLMVRQALERAEAELIWLLTGPIPKLLDRQADEAARTDVLDLAALASRRVMLDGSEQLQRWIGERGEIVLQLGSEQPLSGPSKRISISARSAAPTWTFEY
ncbi:Ryanodine receptor Ryr [Thiorhodococcus mannitoliphagus]|uniref:Ryanodine receptor Ryr n=1 Tax=Thiorhodococcus mannitoliphagus TaxID=329406 RepID=A0A6P1DLW7_9GAMM|nr:RyR domain-containing protein [Thiorhodococcus mannitoliphagus]NEX19247.1 Ryanodine receptor Ryr [Thiorhodococcus mannitoliphagus]